MSLLTETVHELPRLYPSFRIIDCLLLLLWFFAVLDLCEEVEKIFYKKLKRSSLKEKKGDFFLFKRQMLTINFMLVGNVDKNILYKCIFNKIIKVDTLSSIRHP